MLIKLKKDWDIPIQPPLLKTKLAGHFAGRRKEIELLVNEITHKNQGSILISGYRGVGKTSTVYKALSEVKKKEKNILVVLLNAAQLEDKTSNQNQISPERIIQNLIRRLYSTVKEGEFSNNNLQKKIEDLYRKTVASEFKLRENYQRQKELLSEIEKAENAEIFLSEKNIKIMIWMVSWLFAVISQVFPLRLFEKFPPEWLNKIIPLLLAFPIPFVINIVYKKKKVYRAKEELKGTAEELYEFDNSIGNLEFDLEEIHKEFYNTGIKLVYVIDELDKLDPQQVIEVLKFFKNLFTLSKAIFVFIGGETIFSTIVNRETKQNEYRPKEYTYFTSKYFLARPLWEDLSSFIDEIIEEKKIDSDNHEKLKHALTFDARNDFFDLIAMIKDRIIEFDRNGCAIIKMDKLSEDDILKFRFHKSITTVFEDKYLLRVPSRWYENETILRNLFLHADIIISNFAGYQFLDDNQDSPLASAIRDFNSLLFRFGALNIVSETQQNIRGLAVPIRTYQYLGIMPCDPPSKLNELSEIEKRFKNEFERYCSYIIALNNIVAIKKGQSELKNDDFSKNPTTYVQKINGWGFDATSQFNRCYPVYKNLTSYKREDIEEYTKQISNHTNNMLGNIFVILANIIRESYTSLNLQVQQLRQNGNLFSGSAAQIRNSLPDYAHYVIFKPDYSRQILLIQNQLDNIRDLKQIIEDNAETHVISSIVVNTEQLEIKGVLLIESETSEKLFNSVKQFLDYLNKFLGVK